MKEYLKMVDVFRDEMRVVGDSKNMLADDVGIIIGCYSGDKMAEYVLHAINSHDELVAEVERLTLSLNHANINHELFERQYYLEKDKCEDMQGEVERLRSTLQQCVDALYLADKFCGNHTADECGDEIAIPISDALVAASKIVAPFNIGVTND